MLTTERGFLRSRRMPAHAPMEVEVRWRPRPSAARRSDLGDVPRVAVRGEGDARGVSSTGSAASQHLPGAVPDREGLLGRSGHVALGVYGAGQVVGVFIGGVLADRLGARNAT
jgi:hypothetical protein